MHDNLYFLFLDQYCNFIIFILEQYCYVNYILKKFFKLFMLSIVFFL